MLFSTPVLPTLLQDIADAVNKWGRSHRIDPFTDIYNVGLLYRRSFYSDFVLSLPL